MKRVTPVDHDHASSPSRRDAGAAQNDGAAPARGDVLFGLADETNAAARASEGSAVVFLPNPKPANDESLPSDDEVAAMLADDPEFAEVCAARRAGWIDSLEAQAAAESPQNDDDDDAAAPPHAEEKRTPDDCT